MTPRERVLAAIERRQPDRVPIDFGATCWSLVDSPHVDHHPYRELCDYLGIEDYEEAISGPLLSEVCNVDERILDRFGVDVRYLYAHVPPLYYNPQGGTVVGGFGIEFKSIGYYGSPKYHPMRELKTVQEIEDYPFWPDPADPVWRQNGLRDEALAFRARYPDHAIGLELPFECGPQIDAGALLFGIDRFMYNLKNRPDLHHAFFNKWFRVSDPIVENVLGQVGDLVDIVTMANDFGMQHGPMCSHDDYVKHLRPYEARQVARVKRLAPRAKVILHSCGATTSVIKDRAELGVDVLNPMNPLAKDMDAEHLKSEFGEIMSFHGGIDIQRLLPFGTPEEIRQEVMRLIKLWMPTGGWIAAPSHNIQPDTPPENIVAMFDALQEFGDGAFEF